MKLTDVEKYVAMRASLSKEKASLEARLAAINLALGGSAGIATKLGSKPGSRRGPRAKNSMTMKEAMVRALATKALDRKDLLNAVLKLGYKFTAKNALGSISTVLYTDKSFKNTDGKFSVAK